jgi:hypothetical protein
MGLEVVGHAVDEKLAHVVEPQRAGEIVDAVGGQQTEATGPAARVGEELHTEQYRKAGGYGSEK